MATIIAGRFEQQTEAQNAVDALRRAGFSENQVASFFVNPAGQHDRYAVGGDRDKSPGTEDTGSGTAAGMATGGTVGAAIGALTTPVTGPLGAVTGAFVGAHVGSLVGTMNKLEEDGRGPDKNPIPVRHAGMMVAVSVGDGTNLTQAADVLRGVGAVDIERAEGNIANGDWEDFDPVSPPKYLDQRPPGQQ
ncbi:MAG: hypothetical protein JWQ23_3506 [Herminiimonas sp.]|jgi:hypothetical protein|nr:hypothetical protein [Herminiimonas sp.]